MLISSTGIQATFSYCCGQIESISLFDQDIIEHGCCKAPSETGCCDQKEISQDMVLSDLMLNSEVSVSNEIEAELPYEFTVFTKDAKDAYLKKDYRLSKDSKRALHIKLQQFRC